MQAKSGTLRRRLAWLIICIVGVAVTPIAGVLAWRDGGREVALETARLDAAARVIASMAAEAADHHDAPAAFRALRSIGRMHGVEYGRIEAPAGRLLVETGAGARLTNDVRAGAGAARSSIFTALFSQSSEVSVAIAAGGRDVGRVVLLGRTEGLLRRFLVSLGQSLGVAAAAILVGLLIAWRLQERIARPIVALTTAMRDVQQTHDFDRNVEVAADGEAAALVAGFNRMLAEIRQRDGRIAQQMAGLEGEVAARTAELVVARDAAEAANSAKSDFLATMSHEIRTPMNGVMAMAELLAAGELPARERRFADVIVKSGASLIAIINDILDFSKIEAGKLDLEAVRVDPAEIVDDVLSLFWDRAASKGLDLAGYIDPATPQAVAGDPVRLRQIISNLVNNAIKFTENGGVFVAIAPTADGGGLGGGPGGGPGGGLCIAVQDTGIGIAADQLDGVFGAFSQADQSTTRRFGGTGLGLAICKRLVAAMGGTVGVTSTLGDGSRFTVTVALPVLEPAAPWPRAPRADAAVAIAHAGVFTRRTLAAYFAQAGYREAPAAEAAVAIGDPAGLRALQAAPADTICLGSYGNSEPQELVRRGLAQTVLAQPVRRHELLDLLGCLERGAPLRAEPAAAPVPPDQALPYFAGARVLVADDSAVNREVAMEALHRLGVAATLVATGAAAVEAVRGTRFDAVLMDGSMPEMDGFAAARAIRHWEREAGSAEKGRHDRLPIVALTAHVVGAAAEEWRRADMDAVLHKPFTLRGLGEMLGRFLVARAADPVAAPAPAPAVADTLAVLRRRDDLFDPETVAELDGFAARGRGDFVVKVLGLYGANAPASAAELDAAAGDASADRAGKAAHALKSMSYTIGAHAVAAIAAELETTCLGGSVPDPAARQRLAAGLAETLAALGPLPPVATAAAA